MTDIVTIDFETYPIKKRPDYPPKPVGVAIHEKGKKPVYLSWLHPNGNNSTFSDVKRILKSIYKNSTILFHNGKFDLEVAEKYFDLPLVPQHGWHDSMLLAFLYDPRNENLKLKSLAERHLNIKPDEQKKLHDWITANIPGAKKKKELGEFYCLAPAELVGRYAIGDVKRTTKLYDFYIKYVKKENMLEQYDIEKRTVIKAIEMEREGIRIDYKQLEPDLKKARSERDRYESLVQKKLGNINLSSPKQKIEAFEKKGLVKHWKRNQVTGSPKTGIEDLIEVCTDKKLVRNLSLYSKYVKIIGTYMEPWLESALNNDGLFFPWFNTIKGENDKGTYTGRLSSNFQQVPRAPMDDFKELPFLRNYIIADTVKQLLFNRDFSGQEIRILAHFEDGSLFTAYIGNPWLDPHDHVKQIILSNDGIAVERTHVKGCNFLIVYGGGPNALSRKIKVPLETAKRIFNLHGNALPGIKDLKDELMVMANKDEQFITAGGRVYNFEHGKEYVALNTLIQGSAADHSKRALLNIDDMIKAKYSGDARLLLTVHDEFMNSAPKRLQVRFMKDFKEAMEINTLFDVPMLTEGKIGYSWGSMKKLEKGK